MTKVNEQTIISAKLDEYNKIVEILQNGSQVPKVLYDYDSNKGWTSFYIREYDEDGDKVNDRLVFLAKTYLEAISFIRGLKLVISYLPIVH